MLYLDLYETLPLDIYIYIAKVRTRSTAGTAEAWRSNGHSSALAQVDGFIAWCCSRLRQFSHPVSITGRGVNQNSCTKMSEDVKFNDMNGGIRWEQNGEVVEVVQCWAHVVPCGWFTDSPAICDPCRESRSELRHSSFAPSMLDSALGTRGTAKLVVLVALFWYCLCMFLLFAVHVSFRAGMLDWHFHVATG